MELNSRVYTILCVLASLGFVIGLVILRLVVLLIIAHPTLIVVLLFALFFLLVLQLYLSCTVIFGGFVLSPHRVNIPDSKTLDCPLHKAARSPSGKKAVEVLLNFGAKIDAQNKEGDTALHIAARLKRGADIVQLLCENQARTELLNKKGRTPLHEAVYADIYDNVNILLVKNANVNALSSEKKNDETFHETAISIATANQRVELMALILHFKPNVDTLKNVELRYRKNINVGNNEERNLVSDVLLDILIQERGLRLCQCKLKSNMIEGFNRALKAGRYRPGPDDMEYVCVNGFIGAVQVLAEYDVHLGTTWGQDHPFYDKSVKLGIKVRYNMQKCFKENPDATVDIDALLGMIQATDEDDGSMSIAEFKRNQSKPKEAIHLNPDLQDARTKKLLGNLIDVKLLRSAPRVNEGAGEVDEEDTANNRILARHENKRTLINADSQLFQETSSWLKGMEGVDRFLKNLRRKKDHLLWKSIDEETWSIVHRCIVAHLHQKRMPEHMDISLWNLGPRRARAFFYHPQNKVQTTSLKRNLFCPENRYIKIMCVSRFGFVQVSIAGIDFYGGKWGNAWKLLDMRDEVEKLSSDICAHVIDTKLPLLQLQGTHDIQGVDDDLEVLQFLAMASTLKRNADPDLNQFMETVTIPISGVARAKEELAAPEGNALESTDKNGTAEASSPNALPEPPAEVEKFVAPKTEVENVPPENADSVDPQPQQATAVKTLAQPELASFDDAPPPPMSAHEEDDEPNPPPVAVDDDDEQAPPPMPAAAEDDDEAIPPPMTAAADDDDEAPPPMPMVEEDEEPVPPPMPPADDEESAPPPMPPADDDKSAPPPMPEKEDDEPAPAQPAPVAARGIELEDVEAPPADDDDDQVAPPPPPSDDSY
eukprot:CAMPEP_0174895610 /NCGR_PEP_ID=MMETSP0167-20121228/9991_1 /TAXON_ID=38298 /ORGANISM="Rhodella maculata, Strain CCMP736" /LENGTH=881 /DNA_ID=CAMNT_0016134991 /DNA_START=33 /DNA_END=2678 /DNA_ORIENTATION=+